MLGAPTIEELDLRYGRKGFNTRIQMVQDWTAVPEGVQVEYVQALAFNGFFGDFTRQLNPLTREHTVSWNQPTSSRTDRYRPDKWDETQITFFVTQVPTFTTTQRQTLFLTEVIDTYGSYSIGIDVTYIPRNSQTFTITITSWDTDVGGLVDNGDWVDVGGWAYEYSGTEYWSTLLSWSENLEWSANIIPQNRPTESDFVTSWDSAVPYPVTVWFEVTSSATTDRTTAVLTGWYTDMLTYDSTLYTDWFGETWSEREDGTTVGEAWTTEMRKLESTDFWKITWLAGSTHIETLFSTPEVS